MREGITVSPTETRNGNEEAQPQVQEDPCLALVEAALSADEQESDINQAIFNLFQEIQNHAVVCQNYIFIFLYN